MEEAELSRIIDAWIAGYEVEIDAPGYQNYEWAVDRLIWWPLRGEHEKLWRFILAAYRRELSPRVFGILAAGPLEDLLSYFGPDYIDRVEGLAAKDERFKRLVGGVLRLAMTDDVWERVQRIKRGAS